MRLIDNRASLGLTLHRVRRFLFVFTLLCILSNLPGDEVAEAQATTTTTREQFAVSFTIPGCTEMVAFSGVAKIVTHSTIDADGGIHMTRHSMLQHVVGTGLVTNAKYRIVESIQTTSYIGGPFPAVVTGPFNLRIVTSGPGNNFTINAFDRVTINANGTVTSFVEHFKSECR